MHNKDVNVFFIDRIDDLEDQNASVAKALKGISVIKNWFNLKHVHYTLYRDNI